MGQSRDSVGGQDPLFVQLYRAYYMVDKALTFKKAYVIMCTSKNNFKVKAGEQNG